MIYPTKIRVAKPGKHTINIHLVHNEELYLIRAVLRTKRGKTCNLFMDFSTQKLYTDNRLFILESAEITKGVLNGKAS